MELSSGCVTAVVGLLSNSIARLMADISTEPNPNIASSHDRPQPSAGRSTCARPLYIIMLSPMSDIQGNRTSSPFRSPTNQPPFHGRIPGRLDPVTQSPPVVTNFKVVNPSTTINSIVGTLMTALDNLLFDERLLPSPSPLSTRLSMPQQQYNSGSSTLSYLPRRLSVINIASITTDMETGISAQKRNRGTADGPGDVKHARLIDGQNPRSINNLDAHNDADYEGGKVRHASHAQLSSVDNSSGKRVIRQLKRTRAEQHESMLLQQPDAGSEYSVNDSLHLSYILDHYEAESADNCETRSSPPSIPNNFPPKSPTETLISVLHDMNETAARPVSAHQPTSNCPAKDLAAYRQLLERKRCDWGDRISLPFHSSPSSHTAEPLVDSAIASLVGDDQHRFRRHLAQSLTKARCWILEIGCAAVKRTFESVRHSTGAANEIHSLIETTLLLVRDCTCYLSLGQHCQSPERFSQYFDLQILSTSSELCLPDHYERIYHLLLRYQQHSIVLYDSQIGKQSKARVIQHFEQQRLAMEGVTMFSALLLLAIQPVTLPSSSSRGFCSAGWLEDYACASVESVLRLLEHIAAHLLYSGNHQSTLQPISTCSIRSPVDLQQQQQQQHQPQLAQSTGKPGAKSMHISTSAPKLSQIHQGDGKLTCVELINASPAVLFWLSIGVRFVKQSIDLASVTCRLRFVDQQHRPIPQELVDEESRLTRIYSAFQTIDHPSSTTIK